MTAVIVVCTGNVCRSPIAEGLLRRATERRVDGSPVIVSSAGTAGWRGSRATPEAIQAAAEIGVDISAHVARRWRRVMADDVDLVLCMAGEHRDLIAREDQQAAARVFTMKELVRLLEARGRLAAAPAERIAAADRARRVAGPTSSPGEDVADPFGLPLAHYRATARELEGWIDRLVAALWEPVPIALASGGA